MEYSSCQNLLYDLLISGVLRLKIISSTLRLFILKKETFSLKTCQQLRNLSFKEKLQQIISLRANSAPNVQPKSFFLLYRPLSRTPKFQLKSFLLLLITLSGTPLVQLKNSPQTNYLFRTILAQIPSQVSLRNLFIVFLMFLLLCSL